MQIQAAIREKFEGNVSPEPNSGCWLWDAGSSRAGYGVFVWSGRRPATVYAHRASWEIYRGPLPLGAWVLHKCDVPACVNPDHLFLGDAKANGEDCSQKKRHRPRRGSSCPTAKINEGQAAAIFTDVRTYAEIADAYGVSMRVIRTVKRGEGWKHVTNGQRDDRGQRRGAQNSSAKLNDAQVIAIRSDTRPHRTIAPEYGVSASVIGLIKRRRIWTHL